MIYMEQIAKMFNVEFGENFCVQGYQDVYHFTLRGLIDSHGEEHPMILNSILCGRVDVYVKPWKPERTEVYYYVNNCGFVDSEHWEFCSFDLGNYKIGNCYKTEKEAERNIDKWVEFYNSDDVISIE